jgi:Protein of unknown function (DUF2934)
MPTPDIQRHPWRHAVRATRETPPGQPSSGALLESFAALIDHLLTAQTQLISSYLRMGPSVARGSRPATATPTSLSSRPEDDLSAPAPAPSEPGPAPAANLIAARAYQIFVQRGAEPGDPVDDWRRAEAELRADATG